MTLHPVKAAGGRRSYVQAFESIATGQPPRCAVRTLEWLEWHGMIEKRVKTIRRDVFGPVRVHSYEVQTPVHMQWCEWASRQSKARGATK